MGACRHHIPATKDCPWCNRKGDKSFRVRKPFQVYQLAFGKFLEDLQENSLGPACVIYCSEDLNGDMHAYIDGPKENLLALIEELKEAVKRKP